jgi:hypothetical protein
MIPVHKGLHVVGVPEQLVVPLAEYAKTLSLPVVPPVV